MVKNFYIFIIINKIKVKMETLKMIWNWLLASIKRGWNWLLGQTTLDERVVDTYNQAKDRVEDAVDEVKDRVKSVKEELKEAKEAISEAVEQAKDVVEAAQGKLIEGKVTKSKLNAIKKGDLLQHAKDEFGKEFDSKMPKSTLVNKIYGLHKGK